MKITKAEIFSIPMTNDMLFPWNVVLVRLHTDEGLTGLGEMGVAYGVGHRSGAGMLRDMAEAFVIGADPFATENIWHAMQRRSFWALGTGPIINGGMSAIDIALWDIKGKALGQPLYNLLGGPCREKLQAYASQVQFGWGPEKGPEMTRPEEFAEITRVMMEDGYTCVKVNPIRTDRQGNRIDRLEGRLDKKAEDFFAARVQAVRETGGDGLGIIVEFNSKANTSVAIQLGKRFAELGCLYFEEPTACMPPALMQDIKNESHMPLAAGERLYTRWDFLPFIQNRTIALAQPDIGLAGGVTEVKKICDLAQAYDVEMQLHICGSPVGEAASLHMEASIPNFRIHEHHVHLLKPENRNLCVTDNQPVDGFFPLPAGPGIGVELHDDYVKRFPPVTIQ